MTEKEKMINGMSYNAEDSELISERYRAKDLLFEYNNIKPSLKDERKNLIKSMLGKSGDNITIESSFWCDYGWNIFVGENFYANHGCVILDGGGVYVGDNVFLGPGVNIYTAGHPIDPAERGTFAEIAKKVTIGNDVWIGGGCTILPGVTIGTGCVIGAGSIVTKNIPDYTISVGNPCRVLRAITEDDKIGI